MTLTSLTTSDEAVPRDDATDVKDLMSAASLVTPSQHTPLLSQVPTKAGLLCRCAFSTNWCTPPAAWVTRVCRCVTCPSCCRPCWTSSLIKVRRPPNFPEKRPFQSRRYYTLCSAEPNLRKKKEKDGVLFFF